MSRLGKGERKSPKLGVSMVFIALFALDLDLSRAGRGPPSWERRRRDRAPPGGAERGTQAAPGEGGGPDEGTEPTEGRTGAEHATGTARAVSSRAEKGAASEGWAGAVGPPPRAAGKSDGPQTGGRHPRAERARARRTRRPAGGGPKAAGRPKADPEGAHRIARNPF